MTNPENVSSERRLDDLRDIPRITRGMTPMREVRIDAHRGIDPTLEAVRPRLDDGKQPFEATVAPRTPRVEAEAVRPERILVSRLTNAAGSNSVRARMKPLAGRIGDRIIFRVIDTGMGIDADIIRTIAELINRPGTC